jgi:hypothetical protein
LDFSEWARFEPTESSDWTEFCCAIVKKISGRAALTRRYLGL